MTFEPDLDDARVATFQGLLVKFAHDLGVDSFEALLTDDRIPTRHDLDDSGQPLGPYYTEDRADRALDLALGLVAGVESLRQHRPELVDTVSSSIEVAYLIGRLMTIVQLIDLDESIMALALRGKKDLEGKSGAGTARKAQYDRHVAGLRNHWAVFAESIYDPDAPVLKPWTLNLLASRVHSEAPLAPLPSDWDDLTEKDQAAWEKRRNWPAGRIEDQLLAAVRQHPGRWSFERLINA